MRGEWRSEPTWPADRLRNHVLRPVGDGSDQIVVEGDVGIAAWISCAGKPPWGPPGDQREDDGRSLVYEWDPLANELDLLGHPRLRLRLRSPHPVAFLSARLCDVFPDGTSALVSRGVLNLAHRGGHTDPKPLETGVPTSIEVELEATSWVFEAGHRVRLALAGSDWPNTWPPPHGGALELERSSVELELPVLEGPPIVPAPVFHPPPTVEDPSTDKDDEPPVVWRIERDVLDRETRVVTAYGASYDGLFEAKISEHYDGSVGVSTDQPGNAWARAETRYRIEWTEATVATEARLDFRSDSGAYYVIVDVIAEENGAGGIGRIERRFERTIPRRLQ